MPEGPLHVAWRLVGVAVLMCCCIPYPPRRGSYLAPADVRLVLPAPPLFLVSPVAYPVRAMWALAPVWGLRLVVVFGAARRWSILTLPGGAWWGVRSSNVPTQVPRMPRKRPPRWNSRGDRLPRSALA